MFLSGTRHLQSIQSFIFCLFSSSGWWTVGDCTGFTSSIFGAQIQEAQLFIYFIDYIQPHMFKTADYETFPQILTCRSLQHWNPKKIMVDGFGFWRVICWVPSSCSTVQTLMYRIQHVHRFSLIQLVLVCVLSLVGAVNEASLPPTPDQQSGGSWRV